MNHRLLTTLALALATMATMADTVTESQARATASLFFASHGHASKAAAAGRLTLAAQSTGYYLYNRGDGDGFVIVAADDRAATPVLGYADEGAASTDDMPEAMRWWLAEYDRQLAYAARHQANTATATTAKQTARPAIEPLLTTQWSQDSPYNDSCPDYRGTVCYTGCVATAMAQVMRHHKWPLHGTGTTTYEWYVNDQYYKTLSADFSKSTYDWDAMTDTYDSHSTDEQKAAVATLMRDAGLAVGMAYSTSASGAYSITAAQGLVDHFGYDKAMAYVYRNAYSHDEWLALLYGELAEGRPVYLSGYTATYEGHAFVADGYRDGYFHINWGWGGMSDGYFLPSALQPEQQGIGGAMSGFNYQLDAIVGIRPPQEGSDYAITVYANDKFSALGSTARRTATARFGSQFAYYGLAMRSLTLGLKVVAEDGTTTYVESQSKKVRYTPLSFTSYFTVDMKDFPEGDGTYKLYPACLDVATGTWHDVRSLASHGRDDHVVATATGGDISFSQSATAPATLRATGLTLTSKLYAGYKGKGKAVFATQGGDYYDHVHFGFVHKDDEGTTMAEDPTEPTLIDLGAGESRETAFHVYAPDSAGVYGFVVYDADNNPVSDTLDVTVLDIPTSTLDLQLTSRLSMPSTHDVQPSYIEVTAPIKCNGGLFAGSLYLWFFEQGSTDESTVYLANEIVVGEGDRDTVVFKGTLVGAKPSTTYFAQLFYLDENNSWVYMPSSSHRGTDYNTLTFTTAAEFTAITDTQLPQDGQPRDISVYSPSGKLLLRQRAAKADLSTLPAGIYIVKTATGVKKVANR